MNDSLGDRMKIYENVNRQYLTGRMPLIIRLDGCVWHSYTKQFQKPFDDYLKMALQQTACFLFDSIMGCKLVYSQSDEISLLLTDYDKLTTQAWFGKNLQKIVSVSAAMATAKFSEAINNVIFDRPDNGFGLTWFDARTFVLPKEEVANYFLWRENDCSRNSIQLLGQAHFPHKQLQGLSNSQVQDKLMLEKSINWNNLETWKKRGWCVYKNDLGQTIIDEQIPIFSQDREFIDRWVYLKPEEEC